MSNSIDYTNVDYDGFKQMMLKGLSETMPEYTDTSETDPGVVILELLARGLDIINHYQNVQANECFLPSAERRSNVLNWCNILNYTPRVSTPAILTEVIAVTDPATKVPAGTALHTKASDITNEPIYFTTLEDLVQTNSDGSYSNLLGYELTDGTIVDEIEEGNTIKNYLFLVPIIHGVMVNNELLGTSTGEENQEYTLANSPVSVDNLTVSVAETETAEVWTRVDSFIDSSTTDKHYMVQVLENDTVQIIFGDNRTGMIPPSGSIIRATYLNGGGIKGNVGKYTVTEMQTTVSGVSYMYNLEYGSEHSLDTERLGTDKETLSSIKINAPNHFKTVWGCLTVEDYANKLLELFPEIALSDSVKTPATDETDTNPIDGVDVYFAVRDPETNYLLNGPGNVSTTLMQEIREMYEERQLVGTHVNFKDTTFLALEIKAIMYTFEGMGDTTEEKELFNNTVKEVADYLTYYFKQGDLGYNTPVSIVDVEANVVSKISNVRSFRIQSVTCDEFSEDWDSTEIIIPCEHGQIISLDSVTITKRGEST